MLQLGLQRYKYREDVLLPCTVLIEECPLPVVRFPHKWHVSGRFRPTCGNDTERMEGKESLVEWIEAVSPRKPRRSTVTLLSLSCCFRLHVKNTPRMIRHN
jgi:hypothetical protein